MFTVLDWFILLILVGGLIRGYMVGAVRQVGSVVGIVVALLVSVEFMHSVGALIVASIGLSETMGPLVGFTTVFLAVYILVLALARLVEQVMDTLSLSFLNRAAGGAVGAIKAALLLSLLFLVLGGMELPDRQTRTQSTFYQPVAQLLPRALEATERWVPAAKKAADELGRQVRSEIESVPQSSAAWQETAGPVRPGARRSPSRHSHSLKRT